MGAIRRWRSKQQTASNECEIAPNVCAPFTCSVDGLKICRQSYLRLTRMSMLMNITRLSSKGQIIIPKAFRDAHGWLPGLEIEVVATDE